MKAQFVYYNSWDKAKTWCAHATATQTQSVLCRKVGYYVCQVVNCQKLTMLRLARRNSTSSERTSCADDALRPI